MRKNELGLLVLLFITTFLFAQTQSESEWVKYSRVDYTRDSLDKIQLVVPNELDIPYDVVINVNNQHEWNALTDNIVKKLRAGYKGIKVDIKAKKLNIGEKGFHLDNLNFPEASIQLIGLQTEMKSQDCNFSRCARRGSRGSSFWTITYNKFDSNDVILDQTGNAISLLSETFFIKDTIKAVNEGGDHVYKNIDGTIYKSLSKIWRFHVDLPDLREDECKDFSILLTRDWTACRHQVQKVKNGYLFFYLNSDDAPTIYQRTLDPNKDRITYKKTPRCKFINCPKSEGIHIINGKLYVPRKYKDIRICKASQLLSLKQCNLRSIVIKGFYINGCGATPVISMDNSTFSGGAFVKENTFKNISHNSVRIVNCKNVTISGNVIENTRQEAIKCIRSENVTIFGNELKNIGWMLSTRCISATGIKLHICDNIIEDFNYSAIECGGFRQKNDEYLEYIVERNHIRYSDKYYAEHANHSLSDAGGIYLHPENTGGIVRYNVVDHIVGYGANRGIFIDDGARNVSVYGNLIMDIGNCYDIDLRYTTSHKKTIPDHNKNNQIFHNIMTGGYRFEDTGKDDSRCIGGANLLIGIGVFQEKVVELKYLAPDYMMEGCTYKKGKVIIPMRYGPLIDSIKVDAFIRKYLYLQ